MVTYYVYVIIIINATYEVDFLDNDRTIIILTVFEERKL